MHHATLAVTEPNCQVLAARLILGRTLLGLHSNVESVLYSTTRMHLTLLVGGTKGANITRPSAPREPRSGGKYVRSASASPTTCRHECVDLLMTNGYIFRNVM